MSGSVCEPSLSVKSTVAVALRFESNSTSSWNLDISARGKRFLNSEIAWALAAAMCFFASELFTQDIGTLKSLIASCLLGTCVE